MSATRNGIGTAPCCGAADRENVPAVVSGVLSLARATPRRSPPLAGMPSDQFVEDRLCGLRSQDPSQALYIFARGRAAAHDDCHTGVRHVDAFVEHAPSDKLAILPGAETLQHLAALARRGPVGDGRQ